MIVAIVNPERHYLHWVMRFGTKRHGTLKASLLDRVGASLVFMPLSMPIFCCTTPLQSPELRGPAATSVGVTQYFQTDRSLAGLLPCFWRMVVIRRETGERERESKGKE